jgi:hypothetical protein
MGGLKEFFTTKLDGSKEITEKTVDPCKDVFEVFCNLNSVQPKSPMRVPRAMFAAALDPAQSKIFVAGGTNKAKEEIRDVEVYDIKQNMWSSLPSLKTVKSSLSLIVVNANFIYAFGGFPLSSSSIELFYEQ